MIPYLSYTSEPEIIGLYQVTSPTVFLVQMHSHIVHDVEPKYLATFNREIDIRVGKDNEEYLSFKFVRSMDFSVYSLILFHSVCLVVIIYQRSCPPLYRVLSSLLLLFLLKLMVLFQEQIV